MKTPPVQMDEDDFARGVTHGNIPTEPGHEDLDDSKEDIRPPHHDYIDHNRSLKYEEEKSMAKAPRYTDDMIVPAHNLK